MCEALGSIPVLQQQQKIYLICFPSQARLLDKHLKRLMSKPFTTKKKVWHRAEAGVAEAWGPQPSSRFCWNCSLKGARRRETEQDTRCLPLASESIYDCALLHTCAYTTGSHTKMICTCSRTERAWIACCSCLPFLNTALLLTQHSCRVGQHRSPGDGLKPTGWCT